MPFIANKLLKFSYHNAHGTERVGGGGYGIYLSDPEEPPTSAEQKESAKKSQITQTAQSISTDIKPELDDQIASAANNLVLQSAQNKAKLELLPSAEQDADGGPGDGKKNNPKSKSNAPGATISPSALTRTWTATDNSSKEQAHVHPQRDPVLVKAQQDKKLDQAKADQAAWSAIAPSFNQARDAFDLNGLNFGYMPISATELSKPAEQSSYAQYLQTYSQNPKDWLASIKDGSGNIPLAKQNELIDRWISAPVDLNAPAGKAQPKLSQVLMPEERAAVLDKALVAAYADHSYQHDKILAEQGPLAYPRYVAYHNASQEMHKLHPQVYEQHLEIKRNREIELDKMQAPESQMINGGRVHTSDKAAGTLAVQRDRDLQIKRDQAQVGAQTIGYSPGAASTLATATAYGLDPHNPQSIIEILNAAGIGHKMTPEAAGGIVRAVRNGQGVRYTPLTRSVMERPSLPGRVESINAQTRANSQRLIVPLAKSPQAVAAMAEAQIAKTNNVPAGKTLAQDQAKTAQAAQERAAAYTAHTTSVLEQIQTELGAIAKKGITAINGKTGDVTRQMVNIKEALDSKDPAKLQAAYDAAMHDLKADGGKLKGQIPWKESWDKLKDYANSPSDKVAFGSLIPITPQLVKSMINALVIAPAEAIGRLGAKAKALYEQLKSVGADEAKLSAALENAARAEPDAARELVNGLNLVSKSNSSAPKDAYGDLSTESQQISFFNDLLEVLTSEDQVDVNNPDLTVEAMRRDALSNKMQYFTLNAMGGSRMNQTDIDIPQALISLREKGYGKLNYGLSYEKQHEQLVDDYFNHLQASNPKITYERANFTFNVEAQRIEYTVAGNTAKFYRSIEKAVADIKEKEQSSTKNNTSTLKHPVDETKTVSGAKGTKEAQSKVEFTKRVQPKLDLEKDLGATVDNNGKLKVNYNDPTVAKKIAKSYLSVLKTPGDFIVVKKGEKSVLIMAELQLQAGVEFSLCRLKKYAADGSISSGDLVIVRGRVGDAMPHPETLAIIAHTHPDGPLNHLPSGADMGTINVHTSPSLYEPAYTMVDGALALEEPAYSSSMIIKASRSKTGQTQAEVYRFYPDNVYPEFVEAQAGKTFSQYKNKLADPKIREKMQTQIERLDELADISERNLAIYQSNLNVLIKKKKQALSTSISANKTTIGNTVQDINARLKQTQNTINFYVVEIDRMKMEYWYMKHALESVPQATASQK